MISIKCGNCQGTHTSANAVRACYRSSVAQQHPKTYATVAAQQQPSDDVWGGNHKGAAASDSATPKQLDFIRSLLNDRVVADVERATVLNTLDAMTKRNASDAIEMLLGKPKVATRSASPSQVPDVPAGYYAIDIDGTTKFYRVDRPTEGRWAGHTFVKVQASDDFYPQRGQQAQRVLEAIAIDPKAATLRYGHAIGRCGVCHRTLTDEDSRAAGIGPVCASKRGW